LIVQGALKEKNARTKFGTNSVGNKKIVFEGY